MPQIIEVFSISNGVFGGLYAFATIVSSIMMLTVGHTIDHKPVKQVTMITTIGMAVSTLILGFSHYSLIILVVALIGLRLTGQGLLSHISLTVMSRQYTTNRGKALSIAMLGYSVGEAILPLILSVIIVTYNYEVSAWVCALFLGFYIVRLYFQDLDRLDEFSDFNQKPTAKTLIGDYSALLKNRFFWILIPATFVLGFVNTAVFFYQYVFVEQKGWSVALYASFFTAYAVSRFLFSIFGGIWVDKYTAKKLFRIYMIPLILGLIPFAFVDHIFGALVFLILSGCTMGLSGTVKTALLAELFGTEKLGAIRSLFTMVMVVSTALGPLMVGILMDMKLDLQWIISILILMVFIVFLNAQRMAKS